MIVATVVLHGSVAAQVETRSTWDGVYTAEQALRGQEVYVQECSLCHGAQLNGIDMSPSLAGGRFTASWNGVNLNDMVERIRISMPANSPGKLTRQEVADVLAYVLNVNGFPTGTSELPRQSGMLRAIRFDASRQ